MTDQVTGTPAVIPYASKEKSTDSETEIVDRAGNAILGLVSRAADAAAADLQEAHGKSPRNLQISSEPLTISFALLTINFELPMTR
jgi:hypothetical protein